MLRWIALCLVMETFLVGRSVGDDFLNVFWCEPPQFNHLVPVRSFMDGHHEDYYQALVKHLFVTEGSLGRMLAWPRFASEFCVSIDCEEATPRAEKDAGAGHPPKKNVREEPEEKQAEGCYKIVLTSAVESIWLKIYEAKEKGIPVRVKVDRAERKISRELAVATQRTWAKVLLRTRYPAISPSNLLLDEMRGHFGATHDDSTYHFSVSVLGLGTLAGRSRSSEQGTVPRELTQIGLDLAAYARQDEKGKKISEGQLIERLKKLEAEVVER